MFLFFFSASVKYVDRMANSVDPDQTVPRLEQFDLGLYCLLRTLSL